METVDLHVHSCRSDGTYTPSELVDYAIQKKLSAFALTDHDTIDGIEEAVLHAKELPIEVIPGIEFSTEYQGHDIHIVALYIPYSNPEFTARLHDFQDSRTVRNKKMCQLLTEHGIPVTYEALLLEYPDSVITRAHFAGYLLSHGYVKSRVEAFERYIGDYAPCYIPREKITPSEAISFIKEFNGIAVLAHPILYHMGDTALERLITTLKESGLDAIEAIYSTYTASDERKIRALAKKYQLAISGGSDFHGSNKDNIDLATGTGHLFIPAEVLIQLKELRSK